MATRLTVKHLDVFSLAKFVGIVNGIIAIVVGLIGAIVGSISYFSMNHLGVFETIGLSIAAIAVSVVVYPIVMFFLGWLYGAVAALIFNLFVGVSGGIAMTVDEELEKK